MKMVFSVMVQATHGPDNFGSESYWIEAATAEAAGRKAVQLGRRDLRNDWPVVVRVVSLKEIGAIDAHT